jgi:hypothetical protein
MTLAINTCCTPVIQLIPGHRANKREMQRRNEALSLRSDFALY